MRPRRRSNSTRAEADTQRGAGWTAIQSATIGLIAFLLTACGQERDAATRTGAGSVSEDTLVVLYTVSGGAPALLSPAMDDSPKLLVFLPMLDWKWRCWGREEWTERHGWPPPGLAESWEHSAEGTVWTVRLRRDVRWHDGAPVTARDVEFTVELWKDPEVLHYAAGPVDSVAVLDERTVRFFLKYPSDWPIGGWYVFYPKHLVEDLPRDEFFDWEFWELPVGNGPFRAVRQVPHELVELEANPDYPGGKPAVDRLLLRISGGSPLTELLSGAVDLAGVSPLEATKLAGDPRFHIHYHVGYGAAEVIWNLRSSLFGDVRVRRALAHAVDRRSLLRALNLPADLPVADGSYSSCDLIRGELPDPLPHDPDLAAQLLEDAGWQDADGDGVRERNGREFRFTLTVERDRHRDEAIFLQDRLRRVGVAMEVETLDMTAVVDRYRAGDFDAIIRRGADVQRLVEDPVSGYHNPRVTELVETLERTVDMDERVRIYRELGEITRREMPFLNLHPRIRPMVARRRVRGLDRLWSTGNMMGLEHLWIQEER